MTMLSTCEAKWVAPWMLIGKQNDQKKWLRSKQSQGCKCHQPKRGKTRS